MKLPDWASSAAHFLLKIWFPSHHRKITRTVVGVGATLLLDGYFLGGFLQWIALTAAARLAGAPNPDWGEASSDAEIWAGVIVIGLGLLFSILVLATETYAAKVNHEHSAVEQARSAERERNVLQRDFLLYTQFRDQFATNGGLEYFVCHHNFGSSWRSDSSLALYNFVDAWASPEMRFIDPELAESFAELLNAMTELSHHLVENAAPLWVNPEFSCIYDASLHEEMNLPDHVGNAITDANRQGVSIRRLREAFMLNAERRFSILPHPR